MSGTSPKHAVEFILDLFARQGATEYMGEAVTMSQHMEQTAACAIADDAADDLVIAALLHDIGHFIGEHPIDALEKGDDNYHEEVGANYLQKHFAPSISEPVRLHVVRQTLPVRHRCRLSRATFRRIHQFAQGTGWADERGRD